MIFPQYVNESGGPQGEMSQEGLKSLYDEMSRRAASEEAARKAAADALAMQRKSDFAMGSEAGFGDLGFRTGGGTRIYGDPNLDFQTSYGGPGGGYVNFYKDPSKLNDSGTGSDRWSAVRADPLKIVYENYQQQMPAGSNQVIGNQAWASTPTINGIDYSPGQSYAELAKRGIGTPSESSVKRAADFGQGGPLSPSSVVPYTPTTEPGYRPPTYSNPTVGQREESGSPFTGFGFGQLGQPGYKFMAGQFSSQTPGTHSQFFVTQPAQPAADVPNPLLGQFTPWSAPSALQYRTPTSHAGQLAPNQDPSMKALQQFRSQP